MELTDFWLADLKASMHVHAHGYGLTFKALVDGFITWKDKRYRALHLRAYVQNPNEQLQTLTCRYTLSTATSNERPRCYRYLTRDKAIEMNLDDVDGLCEYLLEPFALRVLNLPESDFG